MDIQILNDEMGTYKMEIETRPKRAIMSSGNAIMHTREIKNYFREKKQEIKRNKRGKNSNSNMELFLQDSRSQEF